MKNKTIIKVGGVLAGSSSNAEITDGSVTPTLLARAGTGGNNTPLVAYENPYTNIVINSSGGGIAAPLDSSYYKGQGLRQGIEREFVMIGKDNALCYDARGNGDGFTSPTITGDHNNRITDYTTVVIIDHSRRHDYQPLDVFPTMEAHMGTGGNNVPLVLIKDT